MKRKSCLLLIISCFLLLFICPAGGEEAIPERYRPILEAWGATDGESLRESICMYYYQRDGGPYQDMPLKIRFGGSTEALIREKKSWDLAIVSSKEVDLQKLADEGLVYSRGFRPPMSQAGTQRLYPDWLQARLPRHPYLIYDIYCYDFDVEAQDATLLICQADIGAKKNNPRVPSTFASAITENRPVALRRKTEKISRAVWTDWTAEELLASPNDWDIANLSLEAYDDLAALDDAGLLYDFNNDPYWAARNTDWPVPMGVYSDDGRLIAIPYPQEAKVYPRPCQVVVINAKGADLETAMAYEKHWIASFEWYYARIHNDEWSPGIPKEYGRFVIRKEDVTW